MLRCFVLVVAGWLAIGVQALYTPQSGPIQWRNHVLIPEGAPASFRGSVSPQRLVIQDPSSEVSLGNSPEFNANLDNTITWNHMDWCIEADGTKNGAEVRVNKCTGGSNQKWNWLPFSRGEKLIQLQDSTKCLNVADNKGGWNGAPVELQECEHQATETWTFGEPAQGSVPSFNLRQHAISLIALFWIVALGIWWSKFRKKARAAFPSQGSVPSNIGIGESGVTLAVPLVRTGDVKMSAAEPVLEDGAVTLCPYFKLKDATKFKEIWQEDYKNFAHKSDCVHYSFGFTEDGRAHCREAYTNAETVLQHLADVDSPLKAVLDGPAELERLEVHGPKAEVDKLREALSPLGCKFFVSEWGFRPKKPAMDNDTVCHLYPYFTLKKPDEFKKIWKDAYPATQEAAAAEKSHQYSFSFEGDDTASCRESYGDAEGILLHLSNVDTPLKAVLDGPADLMRLEVHGPKEECDKLQEALGPLGCQFFYTEWGFRNEV